MHGRRVCDAGTFARTWCRLRQSSLGPGLYLCDAVAARAGIACAWGVPERPPLCGWQGNLTLAPTSRTKEGDARSSELCWYPRYISWAVCKAGADHGPSSWILICVCQHLEKLIAGAMDAQYPLPAC
jgi:hypothetical protein